MSLVKSVLFVGIDEARHHNFVKVAKCLVEHRLVASRERVETARHKPHFFAGNELCRNRAHLLGALFKAHILYLVRLLRTVLEYDYSVLVE